MQQVLSLKSERAAEEPGGLIARTLSSRLLSQFNFEMFSESKSRSFKRLQCDGCIGGIK